MSVTKHMPSDKVRFEDRDGVAVIVLSGWLTAADLRPAVDAILSAGQRHHALLINLSAAELIDAGTARLIKRLITELLRQDVPASAAGATGQPLEVLEHLGLAKQLGAHLTVDEAILSMLTASAPTDDLLDVSMHRIIRIIRDPATAPHRCARLREDAINLALPLGR